MNTVQTDLNFNQPSGRFYNTINLQSDQLKKAQEQTSAQAVKVLAFFAGNPSVGFTPFEVADRFNAWPITSVRRAISDLTKLNFLVKCEEMKPGKYGKPNFTWKLKPVE